MAGQPETKKTSSRLRENNFSQIATSRVACPNPIGLVKNIIIHTLQICVQSKYLGLLTSYKSNVKVGE